MVLMTRKHSIFMSALLGLTLAAGSAMAMTPEEFQEGGDKQRPTRAAADLFTQNPEDLELTQDLERAMNITAEQIQAFKETPICTKAPAVNTRGQLYDGFLKKYRRITRGEKLDEPAEKAYKVLKGVEKANGDDTKALRTKALRSQYEAELKRVNTLAILQLIISTFDKSIPAVQQQLPVPLKVEEKE